MDVKSRVPGLTFQESKGGLLDGGHYTKGNSRTYEIIKVVGAIFALRKHSNQRVCWHNEREPGSNSLPEIKISSLDRTRQYLSETER